MDTLNAGTSNVALKLGEDYVDSLIKALQSIAVPRYNLSNKAVEPPLVALRLSQEVFIKGVVTSAIGLAHSNDCFTHQTISVGQLPGGRKIQDRGRASFTEFSCVFVLIV